MGSPSAAPDRVFVRCAAGRGVGLGHVSRCLALAELMEDTAGVRAGFVLSAGSSQAAAMIRAAGFRCAGRRSRPAHGHSDPFERRLRDGDLVVLDDYALTRDDARRVRRVADCRLLVVDDLNRWDTGLVDWVLAFPAMAAVRRYRHTRAFSGPRYTPLRRAFAGRGGGVASEGRVCLVALGGLATPRLLRWVVAEASRFYPVVRVVRGAGGGGTPPPPIPSTYVEMLPSLSDLAAEIAGCDVCICSGGLTKYECIAVGTPAIVIDQTSIEHRDTVRLRRRGLLAGVVSPMDSHALGRALSGLQAGSRRGDLVARLRQAAFGSGTAAMVAEVLEVA